MKFRRLLGQTCAGGAEENGDDLRKDREVRCPSQLHFRYSFAGISSSKGDDGSRSSDGKCFMVRLRVLTRSRTSVSTCNLTNAVQIVVTVYFGACKFYCPWYIEMSVVSNLHFQLAAFSHFFVLLF